MCDLLLGQVLVVAQHQHRALTRPEPEQFAHDLVAVVTQLVRLVGGDLGISPPPEPGRLLAPRPAPGVDVPVHQDGARIGERVVPPHPVPGHIGADQCVLHEVLGLLSRSGQQPGRPRQGRSGGGGEAGEGVVAAGLIHRHTL